MSAPSSVASVTNYFASPNEGFTTTLGSTIASAATTVPLNSVTGLTNASIFVGIIEPGGTNEQVFTGTVDTGGSQVTGVVWTRGTNVGHTSGVTIVDYVTGTVIKMLSAGILKQHKQSGAHSAITADSLAVTGNGSFGGTLGVTGTSTLGVLGAGATTLASLVLSGSLTGTGLASQVQSYSNAGTAGGTFYYINLGGIKLLWGETGTLSAGSFSNNVNLPTSFFTTIQTAITNTLGLGGSNDIYTNVQSTTTTTIVTIGVVASLGSGTAQASLLVIGT